MENKNVSWRNAMNNGTLSLIIPCYNEEGTIADCIQRVIALMETRNPAGGGVYGTLSLEIIVVDDASTDSSARIIENLAARHPVIQLLKHEKNRGKGAAIKTGLLHASGDFVGIQDADAEYDPKDYLAMLEPLAAGKADVVYGSRYLKPDTRRVLYFWYTWMNKTLTAFSNMFTNLDITDMETCYKLFRREIIQKIAPELKEERFGFEPEVTAKVAAARCRVYEYAISYNPRSYEEGKKIGWKDGVHALYCIFHYSAATAPLPMQILLYLFIGGVSMLVNITSFYALSRLGVPLSAAIGSAFGIAALCNYLLCIQILFRHKARWNTAGEILLYLLSVTVMGCIDYGVTSVLIHFAWNSLWAKFWAAVVGFAGNFLLRRFLIFPEKRSRNPR
ncbi:MAG: bifunctional glycosyltransferase family 2/GtrA family protein [Spirochaetaceae bacterium]|nr:bifunctional glycosyltransferase family 2/GtrA family protein [Spirochaetaceae bacterium]